MNKVRAALLMALVAAAAAVLVNQHDNKERAGAGTSRNVVEHAGTDRQGVNNRKTPINFIPVYDTKGVAKLRSPTKATAPQEQRKSSVPPSNGGRTTNDERAASDHSLPTLVLEYNDIGLSRYLMVAQTIGHLFLVRTDGSLGPRLVHRNRWLTVPHANSSDLAFRRPFLIDDPSLTKIIDQADQTDVAGQKVVLVLDRRHDGEVWSGIKAALAVAGLNVSEVATVYGHYVTEGSDVMLKIDKADLRSQGRGRQLVGKVALR